MGSLKGMQISAGKLAVIGKAYSTSGDGSFTVSGVFWLMVPANNVIPNPGVRSVISAIDPAVLSQMRFGTVIEQSFTTGLFLSGTSLAAVQTELQSELAAAQTVLNNDAAPLSGLIGTTYDGSAWATVSPSLVLFDPAQNLASNVYWAAASGAVPGLTYGRAVGWCMTNSSTINKAVMGSAYTPQGTNAQRSLKSSSALDASSGVGAQQVTVTFLDAAFAVYTEVVTLNGTTAVNMVATNCAYIESMVVTACGVTGSNQGTIQIYTATVGGGTVWGSINPVTALSGTGGATNGSAAITFSTAQTLPAGQALYFSGQPGVLYQLSVAVTAATSGTLTTAFTGTTATGQTLTTSMGDNQTFWAHHYVPAGVTCYVLSAIASAYGVMGTMYLAKTGDPSVANQAILQIGPTLMHPAADARLYPFTCPLAVTGPNRIVMYTRPSAATQDSSMCSFEYIQA